MLTTKLKKLNSIKAKMAMVGWLLLVAATMQAQNYTQRNAFNAGATNTMETLNFDSGSPGGVTSLNVGATIGNATFTTTANTLKVVNLGISISPSNSLGTFNGEVFSAGDNFTMTFAQNVRAVGLYYILPSGGTNNGQWTLSANGNTANASGPVSAGVSAPGVDVYFLGIRDNAGFTSVTFSAGSIGTTFFVEDIVVEQHVVATSPELDVRNNADNADITDASTTISGALGTNFGNICVTGGTASSTFRAENNGTGTLTFGTDALAISNTTDFFITTDLTNSGTLAASAFANFTIQFNPTSAGTKTCTVTLRSDDADEDPYTFNIQGVGLHPTVTLAATTSSVAEDGATNLVYQFSRDCTSGTLAVNFSIASSSTAVAGDYAVSTGGTGLVTFSGSSGTITFPTGAATVDLTINPTTDTTVEMDETVVVKIDP
ncbi:MAG: hypothetical protein ACPGXL_01505 [Chitinophagales bacterium]